MIPQLSPQVPVVPPGAPPGVFAREARFRIGEVVKHRLFPFRGVIFDVDPVFANTEAWWEAIPESIRPAKDQPYYHLYAENADGCYTAYVSEQNLLTDDTGPVSHPQAQIDFLGFADGRYQPRARAAH